MFTCGYYQLSSYMPGVSFPNHYSILKSKCTKLISLKMYSAYYVILELLYHTFHAMWIFFFFLLLTAISQHYITFYNNKQFILFRGFWSSRVTTAFSAAADVMTTFVKEPQAQGKANMDVHILKEKNIKVIEYLNTYWNHIQDIERCK